MNSPKYSAERKCLFIGMFSSFHEIRTVVNLGNVQCTEILFLLRIKAYYVLFIYS